MASRTPRPHLAPSTGPATRLGRLVLATAALVVLLAGCATLVDVENLAGEMEQEGFTDATTRVEPGSPSTLVVNADAPSGDTPEEAQARAVEVVWERFPRRFDLLRVSLDGEAERYTYDEIEDDLGARDPELDDGGDLTDDLNRASVVTVAVIAAGGLVFVLLALLVTLLLVRRSRRATAARPPVTPWAPPPGAASPPTAPVPPAAGWGTAAPGSAPVSPPPTATWTPMPRPVLPPQPVDLRKRPVETKADRRRHGRRPRGPLPDAAHTPPGWD